MASQHLILAKVTTEEKVLWNATNTAHENGVALLSHAGRLWLAWTGTDRRLNVMSSPDGVTFDQKVTLDERSTTAPSLTVHNGRLVIGWTGGGSKINVATLALG